MDTQRWQQVRSIFEEALEQPAAKRAAFLNQRCNDDAALRHEIQLLLEAHEDEAPFLDEPLSMDALLLLAQEPEKLPLGKQVGAYRLVHELGHGGMGTVYLAERADGQFDQQVAIKLVRLSRHHGDLVRRFRHEQQILAALQHPHIARLYDGGVTEDGQSYLVMEYVDGLPINQYCDEHRLATRERLALFRTVCEAVQYAHQNLIVHRDLKPSNMLVDANGEVKLLDFGIAKLLGDEMVKEPVTRTGLRLLTPEYASPEQVRGETITTASDVYALGVLLYELLSGHRPYDVQGLTPSAIERVVCEQDPPRPSTAVRRTIKRATTLGEQQPITPEVVSKRRGTQPKRLHQRLRGDLDTIVLTALQKDPARRYESAAQLGEDVRRHLARLPIVARPDTLGYRLTKFVQRHALGVLASALIVCTLIGGIITTTRQAQLAERRFNDVRSLANTLLFDLHDELRDLPGATSARQKLVSRALLYLDNLNREAGDDPSLQLELAEAYSQVGQIQGHPYYTNLGDLAGARDSYQKALHLHEALWQRDTTNIVVQHALANSYGHLSVIRSWMGEDVEETRRRALALLAPLTTPSAPHAQALHDLGRIWSELGWDMIFDGRYNEGLAQLDTAVVILEKLAQQDPNNLALQLHLWRAYSYQADGLSFSDRQRPLLDLMNNKGLPLLERLARKHPNHTRVLYGLHIGYDYLGGAYERFGQTQQALIARQTSLHYAEAMAQVDSTNQKGREAVGRSLTALGMTLAEQGQIDNAVAAHKRAIALARAHYDQNPETSEAGNKLAIGYRFLCRVLADANRLTEALNACKESIAIQEAVVARSRTSILLGNLGSAYGHTARIHRALARRATSESGRQAHLEQALHWYDLGVPTLMEVKAGMEGDSNWEIHPDSLAAEQEALLQHLNRSSP